MARDSRQEYLTDREIWNRLGPHGQRIGEKGLWLGTDDDDDQFDVQHDTTVGERDVQIYGAARKAFSKFREWFGVKLKDDVREADDPFLLARVEYSIEWPSKETEDWWADLEYPMARHHFSAMLSQEGLDGCPQDSDRFIVRPNEQTFRYDRPNTLAYELVFRRTCLRVCRTLFCRLGTSWKQSYERASPEIHVSIETSLSPIRWRESDEMRPFILQVMSELSDRGIDGTCNEVKGFLRMRLHS